MTEEYESFPNNPQDPEDDDWLTEWWAETLGKPGEDCRAQAKQPKVARGNGGSAPIDLSDFDRQFQGHVPVRLEGYVRLGAYMVSLELESFSDASARVMRQARKYGAIHLSDTAFWQLDSWIDQGLLTCIDEPPPQGVVSREAFLRMVRECGR